MTFRKQPGWEARASSACFHLLRGKGFMSKRSLWFHSPPKGTFCPGAKPACMYSWQFLRKRSLGLGAVEKYPFLLGKYLHAKPDIPIGFCEAL